MTTKVSTAIVKPLKSTTRVYLSGLTDGFPRYACGEYEQVEIDQMRLTIVDESTPAFGKRYPVTEHERATYVVVPAPWLRNLSAKPGDEIDVFQESPTTFLLQFRNV